MISNKDILELCDEIDEKPSDFIEVDFLNLESYQSKKLSDTVIRKFEEVFDVKDFEVLTQNGYVPIKKIGITEPYLKYIVKTENEEIECADEHIIIDSDFDEIFAKDLNKDSRPDKIMTINGPEIVTEVINTGVYEQMFDIELEKGSNNLYYINNILSHNSIFLANDAARFVKLGYNTAFISAEMKAEKVIKRIGANLLDIEIGEYDEKSKDVNFIKSRLNRVGSGLEPGKLFIKKYPTSSATVIDIENYLLEVEEVTGHKLKAVIIDYINILSNYRNPNSENTYMKIKQLAEDLRAMGDRNNWLIITATQVTRGAYNSSDYSLEDIAESAGLSHTADMILGIIQDEIMHSAREYWLKILKIRDGEGRGSRVRLDINYEFMRLSETFDIR